MRTETIPLAVVMGGLALAAAVPSLLARAAPLVVRDAVATPASGRGTDPGLLGASVNGATTGRSRLSERAKEATGEFAVAQRQDAPASPVPRNPLFAPLCEGVTVTVLTESSDSEWSAATLRGPGENSGTLRRRKSLVGRERVVYVGTNPRSNEPTVWLTQGKGLCQAILGTPAPSPTTSATTPSERGTPPHPADGSGLGPRRGARRADPKIASVIGRIAPVGKNEFQIERSAVAEVLANPAALLRGATLDPSPGPGIGVMGIPAGSVLHAVGLRNHDRLVGINGQTLNGLEDAMTAYARLSTASDLRLEVVRGGKSTSVIVNVR